MAKYEGTCFVCGKTAGRTALKNHVLKEHSKGNEKSYLIKAESIYRGSPYWLFFSIPVNGTLDDIDDFLREIWLECCGHLSAFLSGWTEYPSSTKLRHFKIGEKLAYEYDFGTSTDLIITFLDEITRSKQTEKVQLLARNLPVEEKCSICNKPALYIDASAWDEQKFACERCSEKKADEDAYYLPITNSPRSGECGYEGFHDRWTFDPKGEFPQPTIKKQVEMPKNLIKLDRGKDPYLTFDDNLDNDEWDDDDHHIDPPLIKEIKVDGKLEDFLESCEMFEIDKDEIRALFEEGDFDTLEALSVFLFYTVAQLDRLLDKEKEGYDFTTIHETHDLLIEFINRSTNFIGASLGIENFTIPKQKTPPKQVTKNVIKLFDDPEQLTAEEKWAKLPAELQEKIMNNVFCIKCGVSSIKAYTIHQESIGIVLRGSCVSCNSPVVRAIEEV